jgi:hypothetical protein
MVARFCAIQDGQIEVSLTTAYERLFLSHIP